MIIFRMQIYSLLLLEILNHERYAVFCVSVCVCACVCVISFLLLHSCYFTELSLVTLLKSLSSEGQIGLRMYSNLHGLNWGMFYSYLPLSEYKHEKGLYNALSFLSLIFQGIFSDLLTLFFPRFLSITIPIGCLFLIIHFSSGLVTTFIL